MNVRKLSNEELQMITGGRYVPRMWEKAGYYFAKFKKTQGQIALVRPHAYAAHT